MMAIPQFHEELLALILTWDVDIKELDKAVALVHREYDRQLLSLKRQTQSKRKKRRSILEKGQMAR